ncbi:MAG: tetratricopeptide repeat protein [Planctomycetes bacterium]|nr:tetratricopeptide repeat protein [Planctomycetota bacterium]
MDAASERRTVTVIFADLPRWAESTASLGPDEARALLGRAFQRFRACVESAGGFVDKFVGEGVMAVFGAPVARGADAVRAVRAALALRDAAAEMGLEARAGVNTGEVLWGTVGGATPTAMGDAVNVAQRLMAAAPPGSVLVGGATEREVGAAVRFSGHEPLHVRGRREPVLAFEAVEATGGAAEALEAAPGPFVGRETELAGLVALVEAGAGGFVWIEGEAGSGKSRLLAEARREARSRGGAWVAAGRALEGARLPLGPFGDLVRDAAGAAGLGEGDADRVAEALRRDLLAGIPDPIARENTAHLIALSLGYAIAEARVLLIEPARLAAETHAAWARWLAARAPAFLCLEDLHAADAASLDLLAALAKSLAGSAVVLAATARPGPARPEGWTPVVLAELPEPAALRLAESALAARPDAALARFLLEKSGGNPYYLEELARYLRKEGFVEGDPARLRVPTERVPAGLHGLLVARLDALPPETREALKTASVSGRTFWKGLLAHVGGTDAAGALEEARRRDMVVTEGASLFPGDSQLAFRHALLRDAAYSLLTKKDRARLHALAAAYLEERAASAGRRARAMAAAHRHAAGQDDAAARLWLQASEEAFQISPREAQEWAALARACRPDAEGAVAEAHAQLVLGRYDEALGAAAEAAAESPRGSQTRIGALLILSKVHFRRGKFDEALRETDSAIEEAASGPARVELRVHRSNVLLAAGRLQEACDVAADALREAPAEGSLPAGQRTSLLAAAFQACGDALARRSAYGEARKALEEALAQVRAGGHRRGVGTTLNSLGSLNFDMGRFDEALRLYQEAEEIWRESGDRRERAILLHNIANVRRRLGQHEQALETLGEVLGVFRELGEPASEAVVLSTIGAIHNSRADYPAALASFRASLEIRRRTGERAGIAGSLNNLGMVLDSIADYPGAALVYGEALEIRREIGDRAGEAKTLNNLGLIDLATGNAQEALRRFRSALDIARDIGNADSEDSTMLNLGKARFALGETAEALKIFESTQRRYAETGDREGVAEALLDSSRARGTLGDLTRALADAEAALKAAREIDDRFLAVRALAMIGACQRISGRREESLARHEEALALARALGDRQGEAETLNRLASLMNENGDPVGALALHREALARFEALGHRAGIAASRYFVALHLFEFGHRQEGLAMAAESMELRRTIGDRIGQAMSLHLIAELHRLDGRHAEAGAAARQSVALAAGCGDARGEARARLALAENLRETHRYADALREIDLARAAFERLGDPSSRVGCLRARAAVLTETGRWADAEKTFLEALRELEGLGDRSSIANARINFASLLAMRGKYGEGAVLAEAALATCQEIGHTQSVAQARRVLGRIRSALGEWTAAAAALEGAAQDFEKMEVPVDRAICLTLLADLAVLQGRQPEAAGFAREALAAGRDEPGVRAGALLTLAGARGPAQRATALQEAREAELLAAEADEPAILAEAWAGRAALGDPGLAALLERATEALATQPIPFTNATQIGLRLAAARLRGGDRAGAETTAKEILARASAAGAEGLAAPLRRFLSSLPPV